MSDTKCQDKSEDARFDELSALISAQREICERLYHEWNSACKALNNFEREQSIIFRKMMQSERTSR